MIPRQLTLKNFLSYRDATLNFRGLHTACICGPNGAGKSSLLEAIAWSLWGQSRAASKDDIIQMGEKEASVDFIFFSQNRNYRVIRRCRRGRSTSLEFQVETENGFRALTDRSVKSTQQKILSHLKLDYDTFINSAYLRQGRADEFMLKSASERKQILADLLKLDRYDELSDRSKERSRQCKAKAEVLEQNLTSLETQLTREGEIAAELADIETQRTSLQADLDRDRQHLQTLQSQQQQRHTAQQQLDWSRQQADSIHRERTRSERELAEWQQQQQQLEQLLRQEDEITAGYARFQHLQSQEETLASKFEAHQDAQNRRHALQTQLDRQAQQLQQQRQQAQAQLEALADREREIQQILSQTEEVEAGLAQLQQARDRLSRLDRLQSEVSPLLHQQLQLQGDIDRAKSRLLARLEQLESTYADRQQQQAKAPHLQQELDRLAVRLEELEKKRVRQQRVREKGLERSHFLERLQAQQQDYDRRIAEFDRKIEMLQVPDAICPLCDRPLDEHRWDLVADKHRSEQHEILQQLWVIKEQLATSEREIQVLRQEYQDLNHALADYDTLRERRGQLLSLLEASQEGGQVLDRIAAEIEQLQRSLDTDDYALDERNQLHAIQTRLQQLQYDEKDHALARGAVDRWRRAEIRYAEIQQAQRQQAQIDQQRPVLTERIDRVQRELEQLQVDSDWARQLADLEQFIDRVGYDLDEHNALRAALRESRVWLKRAEELRSAQQQFPQVERHLNELSDQLQERSRQFAAAQAQIQALNAQLEQIPDRANDIQALEAELHAKRGQLDRCLSALGRVQQQQQQLQTLKQQQQQQQQQLQQARREERVYRELAHAFGKKGIQALTIENVLPQLEAESNRILAKLSANQLHVQFVTQRTSRGSKKSAKLIDTLDILIADARGTRPYETYSGGEAFRINFAIRLALAKLLAQRSGTALQMLIIDEGFGTQDERGCDRLIGAINSIASDFACILTVTHIPHLKEAFQARIEVSKGESGSRLHLSI